jgi:hypothetical protein
MPSRLIRSQFVVAIGAAHDIAEAWKQAAIEKGFVEVRRPGP